MLDQQPKLQSVVMGQMPMVGSTGQHGGGGAQSLQFMDTGGFGGANQPGYGGGGYMAGGAPEWGGTMGGSLSIEDEPPLLEELGIDFSKIYQKTISVLNPMVKVTKEMMYTRGEGGQSVPDSDMAGPLLIALMLGAAMLLRGKIHFGYIYGVGLVGCLSLWLVMTLMSEKGIDIYQTASILGYCLLPMVLLAFFSVFFSATGPIMPILTAIVVGWCSWRSSEMFVITMEVQNEKALVAYPVGLFYSCFALLSIF